MTEVTEDMNLALRRAAGHVPPTAAEAPAGRNDTMNQAIRRQAAEAPAPAEAPDETPDKSTEHLRNLRDELLPVGGEALAIAQRALDEAQLASALASACAEAGVPGERVDDVRALIDLAGVKRNLGGQPSAASVARQVAKLVERLPGLADEPPPKPRRASWDGGARTSGPIPRDTGAEVMAAVRDVVESRRGRL